MICEKKDMRKIQGVNCCKTSVLHKGIDRVSINGDLTPHDPGARQPVM